MNTYYASLAAKRGSYSLKVVILKAKDEETALGKAQSLVQKAYPPDQGYSLHLIHVDLLPANAKFAATFLTSTSLGLSGKIGTATVIGNISEDKARGDLYKSIKKENPEADAIQIELVRVRWYNRL